MSNNIPISPTIENNFSIIKDLPIIENVLMAKYIPMIENVPIIDGFTTIKGMPIGEDVQIVEKTPIIKYVQKKTHVNQNMLIHVGKKFKFF